MDTTEPRLHFKRASEIKIRARILPNDPSADDVHRVLLEAAALAGERKSLVLRYDDRAALLRAANDIHEIQAHVEELNRSGCRVTKNDGRNKFHRELRRLQIVQGSTNTNT